MTNLKTALIAGLVALVGTSAFAADEGHASTSQMTSATSYAKVLPVKAPVLLDERAPAQRIVRIVKEPVDMPVVRKANMNADTKFVFTSPKNTNTKSYIPSAPKNAAMPNLFKK